MPIFIEKAAIAIIGWSNSSPFLAKKTYQLMWGMKISVSIISMETFPDYLGLYSFLTGQWLT